MAAVEELTGKMDSSHRRPLREVTKGFVKFATGDVIFAKITPCMENGKIAIVPELPYGIGYGSTEFHVIRPQQGIYSAYVFYFVLQEWFRADARRHMTGAVGQQRVPVDYLRNAWVPVAPTAEQQRIVARIDELFGEIEAGEQELGKAREGLAAYRRAILKAAVTGELTREWREKNKPNETGADFLADILMKRRIEWEKAELETLTAKGKSSKNDNWKTRYPAPSAPDTTALPPLPQGWCWASLDQLLVEIEAGLNFKCEERPPRPGEVGIVKVSAVTWGEFDEDESKTILDESRIDLRCQIREGDFLFSRANTLGLVGAPVVVRSINRTLLLSDKVLRFRFAAPLEQWMYYVLRSPWGRQEIESRSTGNQLSMRNITQENIRRIRVPLPPRAELQELERRLAKLLDTCAQMFSDLEAHVTDSARLRQSILKAAFSGRLVPQDSAYEPAAVLLQRIKTKKVDALVRQKRSAECETVKTATPSNGRRRKLVTSTQRDAP